MTWSASKIGVFLFDVTYKLTAFFQGTGATLPKYWHMYLSICVYIRANNYQGKLPYNGSLV